MNWRKLGYLGNVRDVKAPDVRGVFEKEFSDVPLGKLKSVFDRRRNKF